MTSVERFGRLLVVDALLLRAHQEERSRADAAAREHARRVAEEQEQQQLAHERRREAQRAKASRAAWTLLGCVVLTGLAVVPIAITLVIGSFGSAVSDNVNSIVFHGAETGSTSGDGPEYLFFYLWKILGVAIFLVGAIRVFVVTPGGQEDAATSGLLTGAIVGIVIFLARVFFGSPGFPDWIWAPALAVAGCLANALIYSLRHPETNVR